MEEPENFTHKHVSRENYDGTHQKFQVYFWRHLWRTTWRHSCFADKMESPVSIFKKGNVLKPIAHKKRGDLGGSVISWAAISYNSRSDLVHIEGNMTTSRYVDELLRSYVVPNMIDDRIAVTAFLENSIILFFHGPQIIRFRPKWRSKGWSG